MQYCMTMEQTRRIAVFFDSDDDEAAIEKANQILKETPSEDYESGDKNMIMLFATWIPRGPSSIGIKEYGQRSGETKLNMAAA